VSRESLAFVWDVVEGRDVVEIASVAGLREHAIRSRGADTVEQAALGGRGADGVGWAFACGYEAALRNLCGAAAPEGHLMALCASEPGGAHPRAIHANLARREAGWELNGVKTWVTLGADVDTLLVVATTGQDELGRNRLRVARVPASREGVALSTASPLPFAPEIAHARVRLVGVRIADDEMLDGDGYTKVLKPFRTLEDTHVLAAILGWAIGVARVSRWSNGWIERALGTLVALRGVGRADPSQPQTHVALAGTMDQARALLSNADWSSVAEPTRTRWERDRPLLDVANSARAARLDAAWRELAKPR
jgi:hypothetical protein